MLNRSPEATPVFATGPLHQAGAVLVCKHTLCRDLLTPLTSTARAWCRGKLWHLWVRPLTPRSMVRPVVSQFPSQSVRGTATPQASPSRVQYDHTHKCHSLTLHQAMLELPNSTVFGPHR